MEKEMIKKIIEKLGEKNGFDNWWENIDIYLKAEIIKELELVITMQLIRIKLG